MSTPHLGFRCECGSSYATENGLKQHQRRYCRGGPSNRNNDTTCPTCNAEFNTYRGMRQHMRHQHPDVYNADLEFESRNARTQWTADEEDELARAEAAYEGNDIYAHLLTISKRTKDALKGRRKTAAYKEKVEVFRQLALQNRMEQQVDDNTNDIGHLEAALRQQIISIPPDKLDHEATNFRNHLLEDDPTTSKTSLNDWCSHLVSKYRRRERRINPNRNNNPRSNIIKALNHPNLRVRDRRRLEYKLAQHEFNHDQKALADRLIDGRGIADEGVMPSLEDLTSVCMDTFTTPSKEDTEPIKDVPSNIHEICLPISSDDIQAAIKDIKSNAPGSDGLSLDDLKKIPIEHLSLLYNSMLLLEHTPTCLKKGRTIFIPKKNIGLTSVKNWRPLTIPPIISRILNRILAGRLSNVELNTCQRGFTKIDGCFANYATIETIIKKRRKKGQPLCLVFIDLSKAFDMVSHDSIVRALRRKNIDKKTQRLIQDNYIDCTTDAACNSQYIGEFEVRRGVKQGDPYSPFLFNAVVDELLMILHQKTGVPIGPETKICALAYADDIVLAATSVEDAQRMIDEAEMFFHKRGLMVNVEKCTSLVLKTVPSKKKVYVATEPNLKIGNESIPTTTIGDAFSYLGQKFSSCGLTPCNAGNLYNQLLSIQRAALKPHQKLCLVNKYLIPRYIASLQRPNINLKILKEVDKKIRAAIRKILSLFQHSTNAILYAPQKSGGLGIFNFTCNIPLIIRSRWENIKDGSQLLQDTYALSSPWINRIRRIIPAGINNKEDIKAMFASALENSFSGGISAAKHHNACRSFINNPPRYWKGGDFVKAVQLRYNLLPCKSIPTNQQGERQCRAGCLRNESLSHILQRCPLTHWQRIKRHNFVVKRVRTAALKRRWTVTLEPHIRGDDGILKKPDILLKKDSTVIICEVGIHWEGLTTLEDQYHHKVGVYSTPSFVTKMQELHPNCEIRLLPLIVGARGTWCTLNRGIEEELELDFSEVQDIITTTLRGGWQTHQVFMRSVWRNDHTQRRS